MQVLVTKYRHGTRYPTFSLPYVYLYITYQRMCHCKESQLYYGRSSCHNTHSTDVRFLTRSSEKSKEKEKKSVASRWWDRSSQRFTNITQLIKQGFRNCTEGQRNQALTLWWWQRHTTLQPPSRAVAAAAPARHTSQRPRHRLLAFDERLASWFPNQSLCLTYSSGLSCISKDYLSTAAATTTG